MVLTQTSKTQLQLNSLRLEVLNNIEGLLNASNSPSHRRLLSILKQSAREEWSNVIDNYVNDDLNELQQQLGKVETAIYQMEQGMYGYCIECEASIEIERLKQDLCTQRCAGCEQKKSAIGN